MKLFTGRYKSPVTLLQPESRTLIGITLGYPKFSLGYPLADNVRALAPRSTYFKAPPAEFREGYRGTLDALGVSKIRGILEGISHGEDVVLLCYEDLTMGREWCHRTLFAEWWKEHTGETVPELDKTYSPDLGFM